jgi:hypothetical protein
VNYFRLQEGIAHGYELVGRSLLDFASDLSGRISLLGQGVGNYERSVLDSMVSGLQDQMAGIRAQGIAEYGRVSAITNMAAIAKEVAGNFGAAGDAINMYSALQELIKNPTNENWAKLGENGGGILLGGALSAAVGATLLAGGASALGVGLGARLAGFLGDIFGAWLFKEINDKVFTPISHAINDVLIDLSLHDGYKIVLIYDPLILDLDGDGIETVAVNGQAGARFDYDGIGVRHATGWVGKDDGFLVRDLNGNGLVDSGAELFGDQTRLANGTITNDGFAALKDLDSNNDGKIDSNDQKFSELKIWRDGNSNGQTDANELITLVLIY